MPDPVGCDTLVVLGSDTPDGGVILAKNSDRPHTECQHLRLFPPAEPAPGSRVRCQYVALPQATHTHAMLGSQPFWLWGFEHGVNEHGVAIGNEAIWMNAPRQPVGLLGMDLIRLALQRGSTAREAVTVITDLLEAHGQGGSALFWDPYAPGYDNSFIVADPGEAWVLETCGRDWAARRARARDAISNAPTIGSDFDAVSASLHDRPELDFARDLVDPDNPHRGGRARHARSCSLLSAHAGPIGVGEMMSFLRSHTDDAGWDPSQRADTLCIHPAPPAAAANSRSQTVAGMVAHLRPGGCTVWCSLATPCIAPFLPFYTDVEVPACYACGQYTSHPESLWWRFKRLQQAVEADWPGAYPKVRARWSAFESALLAAAPSHADAPAADRAAWVRENVDRMLRELTEAEAELNIAADPAPPG